jgi:tRNA/tmRNA/rRNA uracil-C5-methylase (TrmA/RlmC/RlmD family)
MSKTVNWLDQVLELEIEKVAHGGIFVARHEGRVVFVSHTAPGEKVKAKVYEDKGGSYCRAETLEVLSPSKNRVSHIWKEADRLGAGGAEFGHLALDYQRSLKTDVLEESLSRMAGISQRVQVLPVPGDETTNGKTGMQRGRDGGRKEEGRKGGREGDRKIKTFGAFAFS